VSVFAGRTGGPQGARGLCASLAR